VIVVDASVCVSAILPEDRFNTQSVTWLMHASATEVRVTPNLALAEVAGAVAHRTGQAALGVAAARRIEETPSLRVVSLTHQVGVVATRLAAILSLRGADAVYVALAELLGGSLVTWDQEHLARAAGTITVQTPAARGASLG